VTNRRVVRFTVQTWPDAPITQKERPLHHPFSTVRAVLVMAALLLSGTLVAQSPAAARVSAPPRASAPCAALGTYQIGPRAVPRTLSLHRAPPAQRQEHALQIPARWVLQGRLTLTAYTGCGRPTQGTFVVQRALVHLPTRETPTRAVAAPCTASCALETDVVSATGRVTQDPAHAGDPLWVLVSAMITTTRPGPPLGRPCSPAGCPPPTAIITAVTITDVVGVLHVGAVTPTLTLTFPRPPSAGGTQAPRPLVLTGQRTLGVAPTPQSGAWQRPTTGGTGQAARDLLRIACPSVTRCVAVGDQGLILTTTDGGTTWRRPRSGTQHILTGVACPTVLICVAAGAETTILATADGGQTWHRAATPAPAFLVGLACPSATRCIAVGDAGAVVLTTDGGHSWRRRAVPQQRSLASVACPSVQVCYAVGSVGVIMVTRDGGQTWQDESLPLAVRSALVVHGRSDRARGRLAARSVGARAGAGDTPLLTDVACPTVTTCYASGGQVVITTDGGHHWTVGPLQTMHGHGYFWSNGIACLTSTTCAVVGGQGGVLVTRDGGRSWSTQNTPVTQTLHSITCPGTGVCYAVGDKETIVASTMTGGEADGTPSASSTPTVTSTAAAAASPGTALVSGTATTGGFSGATPTPGPSATTVPASGRVILGLSSRGETVTVIQGASIVLAAGSLYVLSHITYNPAVLADAGQTSDGNPALRAASMGTTTVTATASPRCRQTRPACGLPSLLLTYTVHVVSP